MRFVFFWIDEPLNFTQFLPVSVIRFSQRSRSVLVLHFLGGLKIHSLETWTEGVRLVWDSKYIFQGSFMRFARFGIYKFVPNLDFDTLVTNKWNFLLAASICCFLGFVSVLLGQGDFTFNISRLKSKKTCNFTKFFV